MAHAQSSPRGLIAKQRFDVGAQQLTDGTTYLNINNGIRVSGVAKGLLTANSTALVLPGGVTISNKRTLTANSTAYIGTYEAAIPTTDNGAAFTIVMNSTGCALAVNTTGTTWKYLNVTSAQPT